jgi:DNA end-binding protein Ku
MPRAMWSGAISFGLVNIPVKLYRATAPASGRSIAFHLLHDQCGTRIKNLRWCPHCDEKVDWEHVTKGYEVSKGRYVKIAPEELDELLPKEDWAQVAIEGFVELEEIDPLFYDRAYYAAPEGSTRAYALLFQTLAQAEKVAIARVTLRTRSHLAVVRAHEQHLLVETMFYASEIVDASAVPGLPEGRRAQVDKRQLEAAQQLVASMTMKLDPSKYRDEYAAQVEQLVEEKLAGGEVTAAVEPAAAGEGGQVVDLLTALKRSLAQKGVAPTAETRTRRAAARRRTPSAKKRHRKAG